jgi:ketosteroid isomerase-like protein
MSRENVEVVRRFYEVVNQALDAYTPDLGSVENIPGVQEVLDRLDPDAEWDWLFTPDVLRGRDEWLRAANDWLEAVEKWHLQVDDVIDAEDRVVAVLRVLAQGRGSGAPVAQPAFAVITLRDSRILRIKDYTERTEALEAVGLGE